MRAFTILLGVLGMTSAATSQPAEMTISADGKAQAVIVVATDATAPEKHAA